MMDDGNNLPQHVAIIMDGNGRWARKRNLPRTVGHREGVKRVREIVKAALDLGVKVITFFAFSTENWSRPGEEINLLMLFLVRFLDQESKRLSKNNIRLKVIGRQKPLPENVLNKIKQVQDLTKKNTSMTMVLAINYGGRQEILDAVRNAADDISKDKLNPDDLDVDTFKQYLYTAGLPDPDLLIRTSGEMRISNFLLWQLSYTELYFSDKYWPEFKRKDFIKAVEEYKNRERRFGKINVR